MTNQDELREKVERIVGEIWTEGNEAYDNSDGHLDKLVLNIIQAHTNAKLEEFREDVLKALESAFYDGLEQGETEYGGENFNPEDYLPTALERVKE